MNQLHLFLAAFPRRASLMTSLLMWLMAGCGGPPATTVKSGEDKGAIVVTATAGGGAVAPLATVATREENTSLGLVFAADDSAQRIVFLCDGSGSMISQMTTLKDEISRACAGPRPSQSFEIIFFNDKKFESFIKFNQKEALVAATPEAKRSVGKYLEGIIATGTNDPIAGIIAAFKTKPQLIYFLSAGDFPDNDAILKSIRELNGTLSAIDKVKINTIDFLGDGDSDVAFLDLLKTIAKESAGKFRQVKESDL